VTGQARGGPGPAGSEAAVLPHLKELLGGLSALAPLDEGLVGLLVEAGLARGARVLDPACGRGGAALVLAARLGCQVDGVDGSDALVAEAEAEALRRGLPCRFRTGPPLEALEAAAGNPRDAVVWLGLGRALGGPAETVGALRRAVRPGGLVLLEDAYLREGAAPPPGEPYQPRLATLAGLCAHGDLVVGERIAADDEVRAANRRDLEALGARAAALSARRPALQGALAAWLDAQAAQVAALERTLQSATWVIRRGDG
jgi:SAM-dependent methyltransferase